MEYGPNQPQNPQPTPEPETQPKPDLATCTLFEFLEYALDKREVFKELEELYRVQRNEYRDAIETGGMPKTFIHNPIFRRPESDPRNIPLGKLSDKLEKREETPRQKANRLNAMKSTGPRTQRGKARSSQNAIKHGLTAEVHLQTCFEEDGDFTLFQQELHDYFKPDDFYQRQLVGRIVTCMWRLRRTPIVEAQLMNLNSENGYRPEFAWGGADRHLLNLSRYEANLDRQLNRCLRSLDEAKAKTPSPCAQTLASATNTRVLSVKAEGEGAGDGGKYEGYETNPIPAQTTLFPRGERVGPGSSEPANSHQGQGRGGGDLAQRESDDTNPIPSNPDPTDATDPTDPNSHRRASAEPSQNQSAASDETNPNTAQTTISPRRERIGPGSIEPATRPQGQGRGEGDPALRENDKTNPISDLSDSSHKQQATSRTFSTAHDPHSVSRKSRKQ